MVIIQCKDCGCEIRELSKACPNCGSRDNVTECPRCGHLMSKKADTCSECGHVKEKEANIKKSSNINFLFLGSFGLIIMFAITMI